VNKPTHDRLPAAANGMTCREAIDFIMAYLDNELPLEQRHEFERHLSICPSCVNYLNSYRRTVQLAREAKVATAPAGDDLPAGLLRAIRAARDQGA
jgi:anti-sigma factor RsiW